MNKMSVTRDIDFSTYLEFIMCILVDSSVSQDIMEKVCDTFTLCLMRGESTIIRNCLGNIEKTYISEDCVEATQRVIQLVIQAKEKQSPCTTTHEMLKQCVVQLFASIRNQ